MRNDQNIATAVRLIDCLDYTDIASGDIVDSPDTRVLLQELADGYSSGLGIVLAYRLASNYNSLKIGTQRRAEADFPILMATIGVISQYETRRCWAVTEGSAKPRLELRLCRNADP